MENVLAIILGILFGYVLYYVGASSPKKLISMLRLQRLTLMKIIVFGIGFASILTSIFCMLGWFNIDHFSIKATNLGVIVGGLIFGIGFGTVGTCPGTCVTAAGSGGAKKAVSAILGGLFGAWIFAMTFGFWDRIGMFRTMDFGKITLFHISDKYPSVLPFGYWGLLIIGLIFVIFAIILPEKKQETS